MLETILYILTFAAVLFAGFYIGWRSREKYAQKVLDQYYASAAKQFETMSVDIEKTDNQLFVYNSNDGSFIAQVSNKSELIDVLKKKYPNKTVLAKEEHLKYLE